MRGSESGGTYSAARPRRYTFPGTRRFTIKAETELRAAVCKCPAQKDYDPVLVRPEDVIVKDLGRPGWKRQAHFIVDERLDANLIYVGEAFGEGGTMGQLSAP